MQCIRLTEESVKMLGIHFSYNKKLEEKKSFYNRIAKIENILKVQRMKDLTIEGKIVIFKSLVVSKIVHLALIKSVPILPIEQLNIMKKNFIWKGKKTKIEQCTLCNSNENGDLKDVDIFYKIISLQCSWIRRIFDNNFHDWKVIALFLIKKKFEENFKFHSNVHIPKCSLNNFPCFYKETVSRWKKYFLSY